MYYIVIFPSGSAPDVLRVRSEWTPCPTIVAFDTAEEAEAYADRADIQHDWTVVGAADHFDAIAAAAS